MEEINLNFGCGSHAPRNWKNFDVSYRIWIDRIPLLPSLFGYRRRFAPWVRRLDVTGGLPFGDASVHRIYTSHMIEHLTHIEAERFMLECHRILVPGGRIRVMTPNVRFPVENYMARRNDPVRRKEAADYFMRWLGVTDETECSGFVGRFLKGVRRKNLHHWLYDENSLAALMESARFTNVSARDNWISDFPDLSELEPEDLRVGSVCAEGYRTQCT